jgi:hypothetical protein
MAKIVENEKGFKVINVSLSELHEKLGGLGICDWCNMASQEGYLVAVLNHWYCPKCYQEWIEDEDTIRYEEDAPIENRNFERYKKIFNL